MNLLHMKYAVTIAETKSINKAAEKLYVGQSALSRAVKELETSLGAAVFERSSKGMTLTPSGEEFIRRARSILEQVDSMENMFRGGGKERKRFSVSVPHADYIAEAFALFSGCADGKIHADLFFREADAAQTVKSVIREECALGIIRYEAKRDREYKSFLDSKELDYELICEFSPSVIMNSASPLADSESVTREELRGFAEVVYTDRYDSPDAPPFPAERDNVESADGERRYIHVFDRAAVLSILSSNPYAFARTSPVPKDVLEKYGLVQKKRTDDTALFKDVLIHRKDHCLSESDRSFIERLVGVKRETL